LARIHAPYEYGGALAEALVCFKWRGRDDLARPLGQLLAPTLAAYAKDLTPAALVVPVPLHPRRLRQRGYNQAVLLGRAAVEAAGLGGQLPLLPSALRRVHIDPPSRGIGPQERFGRTQGAFAVHRPALVAGKQVLLIDDVVTTGATVLACATALVAAGAERVEALALLRAPSPELS